MRFLKKVYGFIVFQSSERLTRRKQLQLYLIFLNFHIYTRHFNYAIALEGWAYESRSLYQAYRAAGNMPSSGRQTAAYRFQDESAGDY
jgi:hypothetical protein